ncbi:MAG: hypothetical protein WCQ72_04410 [Eubacteriales bacterium]
MFNFIRENSYTIIKMGVNQIGMTVFGLMLAMATSSNSYLLLLTSIFAACFYMVLLYTMSWDCGAKDKIRVDGGRAKYTPFKGVNMSLVANTINIILAVCIIIGYYSAVWTTTADPVTGMALMEGTPQWASNLYGITNMLSGFLSAMYLGIIKYFLSQVPFAYLLAVIPSLCASGLGYYMGLNNRRIFRAPQISGKSDKK